MDSILALRPFVPARDFPLSQRFYQALGFTVYPEGDSLAFLKMESFSFILQKFYAKDAAENFMMQMLVRDVTAWWARIDADRLVAEFGVKPPRAPAVQPWGMKVGFLFDPSGVLWHIVEAKF
jgi:catechol 2,3-dioxygenase-like lactoylglutathione lyase family enzyme